MRRPGRVWLAAAAATVVVAGLGWAAMPSASAATNLVTNPGFETGTLTGWTCDASDSVVTGHAHAGTYALQGAAGNDTAQCTQTINVVANTAYTLSAAVQGAYVFLGVSGAASTQTWTTSTTYTTLTLTFTTGTSTSLTIYIHGWYGQGTYYADDLTLTGPGGTPSPSQTKTTSPSPTPSASPSKSPSPSPSPTPTGTPPPPRDPGQGRRRLGVVRRVQRQRTGCRVR